MHYHGRILVPSSSLWAAGLFLSFFPHSPRGQTPQPIFTPNGSNDVDSRNDVPFAVKIATFHTL